VQGFGSGWEREVVGDEVRAGLVGASAGAGWSSVAHVPSLRAAEGIELAAVCASRPESAAAGSDIHGVPGFHDVRGLAAHTDIDLIAVVVRVPRHCDVVMAALDGGKHVFSEGPLGANQHSRGISTCVEPGSNDRTGETTTRLKGHDRDSLFVRNPADIHTDKSRIIWLRHFIKRFLI
jgi:hypothetical protein